jgi:hypothetical protein
VISFAALHKLARAWADLRQQGLTQDAPPVLVLCQDCEAVLLRELAAMFEPVQDLHRVLLPRSQVMGFTFEQGPPAMCALHPFLQEAAPCP